MPNFFLSYKRAKVAGRMHVRQPRRPAGRTGFAAPDLKQTRRDPAQGPPESAVKLLPGQWSENAPGRSGRVSDKSQERQAMKLFTGWVMSAGLALAATSANAQMVAPTEAGNARYQAASDVGGPYAAMPPDAPAPGYGPRLLPGTEVYTVVRENGFSPLGIPQQHGYFYTIAVINRGGEDGRLVIDARDGRIVRFVPGYRVGSNYDEGLPPAYGQAGALPPINQARGVPRPPASVPHVASRTPSVPLPKAMPPRADEAPLAAKSDAKFDNKPDAKADANPDAKSDRAPTPAPQSMAMQTKPVELSKSPQNTAPAPTDAKPAAAQIQPTQEMPKVQGLE
jgi:hypothetical protein